MSQEKQIQDYESKKLIEELSKMPPMVIATAYLHAMNDRKMIYLDDAIDAVAEGLKRTFVEYRVVAEKMLNKLPSAQPFSEEEIQKIQDLEQAELEKAFELGREDALSEIVRCKDCKWKQGAECVRFAEIRPFPNDFCSRAERKDDEENETD